MCVGLRNLDLFLFQMVQVNSDRVGIRFFYLSLVHLQGLGFYATFYFNARPLFDNVKQVGFNMPLMKGDRLKSDFIWSIPEDKASIPAAADQAYLETSDPKAGSLRIRWILPSSSGVFE